MSVCYQATQYDFDEENLIKISGRLPVSIDETRAALVSTTDLTEADVLRYMNGGLFLSTELTQSYDGFFISKYNQNGGFFDMDVTFTGGILPGEIG